MYGINSRVKERRNVEALVGVVEVRREDQWGVNIPGETGRDEMSKKKMNTTWVFEQ